MESNTESQSNLPTIIKYIKIVRVGRVSKKRGDHTKLLMEYTEDKERL